MSQTTHVDDSKDQRQVQSQVTLRVHPTVQTAEERQLYVDRVLDLMQIAESGLLGPTDPQAVGAAIRAISAVKDLSSGLNYNLVASEASLITERAELMGTLGETDRGWLLVAIDRLRLLAVDPHYSSTPKDLIIPVAMAHIERLNTVIVELSARLDQHPDPQVGALLSELHASSKLLLRTPVAPLVSRLQAHALRFSHVLATRGDDLTFESHILNLLENITPPLITAAVSEVDCDNELTLLFVDQGQEIIVRLACGCGVQIPDLITNALGATGSIAQDDGIVTIRIFR